MYTNEELRVPIFGSNRTPTQPSVVRQDTPLEALNLTWREHELCEKERTKHVHRLHPYLGKFIPQLVEVFLRKYFQPGTTVLDPFCGSGTTLVQANELGVNSVGYDISAFSVLLCRAKTSKYNLGLVRSEVLDILEKTHLKTQKHSIQLMLWEDTRDVPVDLQTNSEYLRQWFAPQALEELLTYRTLIDTEGYTYRDLLMALLCRSARSARLTTHFELDFPKRPQAEPYYCHKHLRTCQPVAGAYRFLQKYSIDTLQRIWEFAAIRTQASVRVVQEDARKATFPPIAGVITSPPYLGLIDYHEQHVYAYHLLGLRDQRESEIGPAVNGSSQKAQRQYEQDIAQVFRRATQTMPSGGRMIVVAADRGNLYRHIAELAEVETEAVLQRDVNGRTGRRSSEFCESVFIWRKP